MQELRHASPRSASASAAPRATATAIRRPVTLVCVGKTFDAEAMLPALQAGERVFGENRVQEAQGQSGLRCASSSTASTCTSSARCSRTRRRMLSRCSTRSRQSTRPKIAAALAKAIDKVGRHPHLFVQVNTGAEPQKAGVLPQEADAFIAACPPGARADDRRAHVHPAVRRAGLAAFRAARQDRRAQWDLGGCRWA